MARNGSGTYSLPSGNPVVTLTTISSTDFNNTMTDLATALTDSIAKDGQTTPTANLTMGGFRLTNLGAAAAAGDALRFEQLMGSTSPTQITSDQNDYNPTSLSSVAVLRLSSDAARDITGLAGGASTRRIVLANTGSYAITLKDESSSSSAANRFALSGDAVIPAEEALELVYDSTSSRWRVLSKVLGSTANGVVYLNSSKLATNGSALVFDGTNLGVGTSSPDALLTVNTIASFGAGAAATPSIAAKGDLNTGMWFPAADTLAASTGGSERMRIDSSGNVGIGTTAPDNLLHLKGASGVPVIRFQDTTTHTPANDVALVGLTAGVFNISLTSTASPVNDIAFAVYTNEASVGQHLGLYQSNTGNVGIGTTSPGAILHVNSSAAAGGAATGLEMLRLSPTYSGTAGSGAYISFVNNTDNASLGQIRSTTESAANVALSFSTYNTSLSEKMRLSASGNLGIGTTGPTARLTVDQDDQSNTNPTLSILGRRSAWSGYSKGLYIKAGFDASDYALQIQSTKIDLSTRDVLYVRGDGNVGIGTTSPSYQLQLSSDSAAKPSTNTWTVSSDERIKRNILPYEDGLAMLLRVEPVTYQYNGLGGFAESDDRHIGIIAQALQPVAPYMIASHKGKLNPENPDEEEIDLLDYNGHAMTFALINAVKELHGIIQELKARLDAANL